MREPVLVLGIGNLLLGDEAIGVEAVRRLQDLALPPGVECLDGGTGGFVLLGPLMDAERVILIDATADGQAPGTLRRLEPRFSRDYPRTLTAHDIGLKDLLDAFYLMGSTPRITLFAISIEVPAGPRLGLSPELRRRLPAIVDAVLAELQTLQRDTA